MPLFLFASGDGEDDGQGDTDDGEAHAEIKQQGGAQCDMQRAYPLAGHDGVAHCQADESAEQGCS